MIDMKRIMGALALIATACLFVLPLPASQGQVGIINPGEVLGNGTTSPRAPLPTPITSAVDQGICKKDGSMPIRLSGTWICSADYSSFSFNLHGTSQTFPASGNMVGTTDAQSLSNKTIVAPVITGHPTVEGVTSTGATGTGQFVFGAAPHITAPTGIVAGDVGLGNVTNDTQTKAAIVPNTAPSAGQVPVGNAGGTAYAPKSVSGDASLASTGAVTVTGVQGLPFQATSYTNGQVPTWSAGNGRFQPGTPGGGGVAACGWRQNMAMEPQGPNWTTKLHLVGPAYFVLCNNAAWIPSPATVTSTASIGVQTIGAGGYGTANHSAIDVTVHSGAGCTSPCVSTETTIGGVDPGDASGSTLQANLVYNVYLVARDPANAPNDWGLVISSGAGPNGRSCTQGPSATVQAAYPYYSCISWFYSNGSANGMAYQVCKSDHWWWFCGNPGALVSVANGSTAGAWTLVFTNPETFGITSNTGTYIIAASSVTAGTYVSVAANNNFGSYNPCQAAGVGSIYVAVQCTQILNGGMGYKSTDASGFAFVVGGYDGF